jgi:hypothetical protein
MDAIQSFLSNSIFKAVYDPVANTLREQYNTHLADKVNQISQAVFGPMEARYNELMEQPGVKKDTLLSLRDLLDGAKAKIADPSTINLNNLTIDWFNIQQRYNLLNEQAKQEADYFVREQAKEAEQQVTQAEEDKTFNIYRMFSRILETLRKYMFVLIIIAIALLGGSFMSNRAVNQSFLFRLYYLVYGTLLFPLSYYVVIQDFTVQGRLPHMYAILAPLFESKNFMATTRTLLFPFMYTKPVTLA